MMQYQQIKYTVQGDSGTAYTVSVALVPDPGTGAWSWRGLYCACKDWQFRRRSARFYHCKHIQRTLASLEVAMPFEIIPADNEAMQQVKVQRPIEAAVSPRKVA